MYKITAR